MTAKVRTIIRNNRRLTVREIADDCGISVGSCDAILTDDLHMKRVRTQFVLRLLTDDQREQRQTMSRDLFELHVKTCIFLRTMWQVTSPGSTGTTRRQNSNRHSGSVTSLRDQRRGARYEAKQRSCYGCFFLFRGYRTSRVRSRRANNKEFYVEVLRRLHESVRRKRPEKWRDGDWILHNDNALAHTSHLVQQFLAKHRTAQLQQPPYSPDLAPCDFFLFSRIKKVLKGHRFEATEDIKRNSTKTQLDIPKEEFAKCFQ